jgi:hypothetical protein
MIARTPEEKAKRQAERAAERAEKVKVVQARRATCDACPHRVGIICGKCGCPTVVRTRFGAHCPIHKW